MLMEEVFCCNILKNNDKMYLKIKKDGTLLDLRNALEKRRNFNSLLFLKSNGNYFSKEKEKFLALKSIKNKIINFTEVDTISINIDNKFLCNINIENIPLNKLRIQLREKINPQYKFFFENAFILDEENFKVFEICKNNIIEMNKISNEIFNSLKKEENFINNELIEENIEINNFQSNKDTSQLIKNFNKEKNELFKINLNLDKNYQKEIGIKKHSKTSIIIQNNNQENIKRNESLDNKNKKVKKLKYNPIFNNEVKQDFLFFECSPDISLSQVRKNFLPSKYQKYIFLYEGYPIGSEKTKISEIAKDNKIYLKYEGNSTLQNKVLNGCLKLNKNSIYDYYLYQNSKFNQDEEKKCISLLLLGGTGTGKTTFLNGLINFVLKVDYFDTFRYLLVNEEGPDKILSQTKQVNIYYIKSHNSYPPIKIIDTPGFNDTSGHEFDKEIARMIFKKFKEIKELNAVCIVCKYNEERFNYSQLYIFNCIINLFGKDMADNFIILFTFCDVGKIISIKCFEENDSPFSKIINKMKAPWYLKFNNSGFFAEKKNEIIEEFFKIGNESFTKLLNKLKLLEKKNLELSSDVNIKREKLDYITSYVKKQIISLHNYQQINDNNYPNETLYFYYCNKCKFFSDNNKCIICKNPLDFNYGNKYFNFNQYCRNGEYKLLKYKLEIYSNLFQLEKIMKEYNNITLKNSNETLIEFLYQIQNENNNSKSNINIINEIIQNYQHYRNGFTQQMNNQKEFALYLFNKLI